MGRNQAQALEELRTKDEIIRTLKVQYPQRFFVVSTSDIFANKSKWASRIVKEIYQCDRNTMTDLAYHFAYIKFAKDKKNNVYGIVGGKSQFHHKNPSDVCFYDINADKHKNKDAAVFMQKNHLEWYTDEIVILKNEEYLDEKKADKEARANEKALQSAFCLFD